MLSDISPSSSRTSPLASQNGASPERLTDLRRTRSASGCAPARGGAGNRSASQRALAFPQTGPSRAAGAAGRADAPLPSFPPTRRSPSHARTLFRFLSDTSGAGPAAASPFALSPLGGEEPSATAGEGRKPARKIARSPFKVLDAPQLQDDFYLNLVDWSRANMLAVGLGSCVYLWNASTGKVTKLCDLSADAARADVVTSVAWTQRGSFLAVGTHRGDVQLWDWTAGRCVRTLTGHRARACSLAWHAHSLCSGSRDKSILQRDVRAPGDFVTRMQAHRSEVCGLRWSPDGRELASGGNDNVLLIWSARASLSAPLLRFEAHNAAVKALAWSPHSSGLLASGGGTADRCIRFWNTVSGTELQCVDTGSQVCNLAWSRNVDELVSTHGYSQNQVVVWRYPGMTKLATLTGHTMRVLYLAVSPDGQTIVTGAGDETLRFWNLFPGQPSQGSTSETSPLALGRSHIR